MEKITTSLRLYHYTQNHTTITQLQNSNPNLNYCTPFSIYISTNRPVLSLLHNSVSAILSHLIVFFPIFFFAKLATCLPLVFQFPSCNLQPASSNLLHYMKVVVSSLIV